MKIRDILAIMAVAVTAVGCNQQDDGLQQEERVPILLKATVKDAAKGPTQTRTATTATTQNTEFLNGQLVKVWIKENDETHTNWIKNPIIYEVKNDNDGDADDGDLDPVSDTQSFFFPIGVNIISIFGVHPSTYTSNTDFTVAADQTSDGDYAASDLCYSQAADHTRTTGPVDANGRQIMTFQHALSKIVVEITTNTGKTLPATVKLLAKRTTKMTWSTGSDFSVQAEATGDASYITMGLNDDGTGTKVSGGAIIPPQTIAAGTSFISFTVADLGPMIYPLPASTSFTSGKRYTYKIKVNNVGITATTDIDDWGTKVANQTVLGKRTFRPPLAYIEGTTNLTASSSDIVNNKYVGTTHRMATTLSQASTAYFTGVTAMNTFKNRVTVVEPDGVSTGYYHLPTAKEWMSILPPDFTNSGTSGNYLNAQGFTISGSDNQRIQWGVGYNYNMEEPAAWGAKWDSSTSTYTYEVDRQFKNDYYCPSGVTIGYGLRFKELDGSNGQYTCAFRYEYQANYNSTGWPMLIVRMKYVGNNTGVTITTIKEEDYWTSYDYEAFLTGYGELDSYNDYPAGPTGTKWNEKGYYWAATRNTGTYAAQYCMRFDNIDVQGNTFHTTYSMLSIPVRLFRDTD